jgi:glycosyltransferase involved in cell wall biosynthesis
MYGKRIVMLSSSGRGGILSVIDGYYRDGLFDRWLVQRVYSHEEGSLLKRMKRAFIAFLQIISMASTGRIALLHCHVAMNGSFWRKLLLARSAQLFGVPVLFHLHSGRTRFFYNSLPRFMKCLFSKQLTDSTAVLVLSESWRLFVLEVAPNARVILLPNYVEMPLHVKPRIFGDKINVLFLGLIGENKGIYDLLSAFSAAIKNVPQLFLYIGGNGDIEKAKIYASKHGLDAHVKFLGWVSGNDKKELMNCTDIFVLPSYNEGLSVSVLEAMSWGIPVITTPVGGMPELIDDQVNGFMIAPGDIFALQRLLEKLGVEPDIRFRIGMMAKETILRGYSKDIILTKLEFLYADYVKNKIE